MKKRTVILIGILVTAAVCGGGYGISYVIKGNTTPVAVTPVTYLNLGWWGNDNTSYGTITANAVQEVYLSSDQLVSSVNVQAGDRVEIGDVLLTYDSTLLELNLESAELSRRSLELQLLTAQNDLEKLKKVTPVADPVDTGTGSTWDDDDDWDYASLVGNEMVLKAAAEDSGQSSAGGQGPSGDNGDTGAVSGAESPSPVTEAAPAGTQTESQTPSAGTQTEPQTPSAGTQTESQTSAADSQTEPQTPSAGTQTEPQAPSTEPQTEPQTPSAGSQTEPQAPVTEAPSTEPQAPAESEPSAAETPPTESEPVDTWDPTESETPPAESETPPTEGQTATPSPEPVEPDTEEETEPETSPLGNVKAYSKLNYKSEPYKGEGTKEDPYVFFCKDGAVVKASFMNMVLGFNKKGTTKTEGGFRGDGEGSYVVLEIREGDDVTGGFVKGVLINGTRKNDTAFDPSTSWVFTCEGLEKQKEEIEEPETEEPWDDPYWDDPYWGYDSDIYTVSELKEAIRSKEEEIKDLQLEIRSADLSVQRAQRNLDSAYVKATLNGVVKSVGDGIMGDSSGQAYITVTSDTGMYVKGTISELELSSIQVGSIITGAAGDYYQSFTAEITEISEYPASNSDYYYYGDSNPNVSYYPFTAYIDNAEGLNNNDWAEITIQSSEGSSDSIYISKRYVRSENGQSYVYKAGSDNRLVKQYVKTGQTLYSEYVEIKQGLDLTDSIAFPYGKNVFEGAPVQMEDEDGSAEDGEDFGDLDYSDDSSDDYGDVDDPGYSDEGYDEYGDVDDLDYSDDSYDAYGDVDGLDYSDGSYDDEDYVDEEAYEDYGDGSLELDFDDLASGGMLAE